MGKVRHLVGIAGLVAALVLVAGAAARKPHVPFRRTLGLHIGKSTVGVCVVRPPATSRLCTAGLRSPRQPLVRPAAGGRQLHEFPVHVPFAPGSRIGLDMDVTGDGKGEASVPIADAEGELNLNAIFEQGDQTPPVLRYTYAHHQDFLHTRRAYVRVRSNERVLFNPDACC